MPNDGMRLDSSCAEVQSKAPHRNAFGKVTVALGLPILHVKVMEAGTGVVPEPIIVGDSDDHGYISKVKVLNGDSVEHEVVIEDAYGEIGHYIVEPGQILPSIIHPQVIDEFSEPRVFRGPIRITQPDVQGTLGRLYSVAVTLFGRKAGIAASDEFEVAEVMLTPEGASDTIVFHTWTTSIVWLVPVAGEELLGLTILRVKYPFTRAQRVKVGILIHENAQAYTSVKLQGRIGTMAWVDLAEITDFSGVADPDAANIFESDWEFIPESMRRDVELRVFATGDGATGTEVGTVWAEVE